MRLGNRSPGTDAHVLEQPGGVAVINFSQHLVREVKAVVHPPGRIRRPEKLILGLQQSEPSPVHLLGGPQVRAVKDPVLVLDKKSAGGKRLSSQVPGPGRDIDIKVGIQIQQPAQFIQVMGEVPHVAADKNGVGMFRYGPVAGVQDIGPGHNTLTDPFENVPAGPAHPQLGTGA